ncbi:hypothetical protein BB560_006422, partial [Smittium megazygosporum]
VIESDGKSATISTAIKCASIALVNASIDLYDMVSSVSANLFGHTWVIDCTQEEEDNSDASVLVSYMPSSQEITHIIQSGKGINTCVSSSSKQYQSMAKFLKFENPSN